MILELFQYEFMQRALIVGTVVAVLAPLIGIFLVIRRFSQLSDTLSHVSLVGVALGLLLNTSPIILAVFTSVLASLGIEKIRQTQKVFSESVLVLFLTGSLGLATLIISLSKNFSSSLYSYLFGSLVTITTLEMWSILGIAALVFLVFGYFFRSFFLIAFDEEVAQTSGLNVEVLNYVLMAIAALVISISIRIVGVLLVSSLMIVPVITSLQFKLNFKFTLAVAVFISIVSVWTGLLLSYYQNLATGGTIAVVNLIIFGLAFIWQKLG